MTIPCITMQDTRPTFYLVPVTTALSDAVACGTFPPTQTRVSYCPTLATGANHGNVGVGDKEYRELVLKGFLGFKDLAETHWEYILEGSE